MTKSSHNQEYKVNNFAATTLYTYFMLNKMWTTNVKINPMDLQTYFVE